jgi:hypothetical protein
MRNQRLIHSFCSLKMHYFLVALLSQQLDSAHSHQNKRFSTSFNTPLTIPGYNFDASIVVSLIVLSECSAAHGNVVQSTRNVQ